ncbi:MAG: STAS domain-containing protein [Candidatus Wallbacteria bacterium]|nr:STAS domain-containing protein [Candidatus Wallbacteria bacterium]
MELSVRDGIQVVSAGSGIFRDNLGEFRKIADKLKRDGALRVVVDFEQGFVAEEAHGILLSLWKNLRERNGELLFTGVSTELLKTLDLTRINRVIGIVRDLETACDFLKTGKSALPDQEINGPLNKVENTKEGK